MTKTELKKELDELKVDYPAKASNEELKALLDEARAKAKAKGASQEIEKRPLPPKPKKVAREEFVLADILVDGTTIKGREYQAGEQESLSPQDFEILEEAGAVKKANGDAAAGPKVMFEVIKGSVKRPRFTAGLGGRFGGPQGLLKSHPGQLKIVGTL